MATNASENGNAPGEGWSNGEVRPEMFPATRDGKIQQYSKERRWINLQKSWTRIGAGSTEYSHRVSTSGAGESIEESSHEEAKTVRSLIAQLCEHFFRNGWATGTAGGVSIRVGGPSENRPWRVFVAPSGIQKEDMIGDDIFELDMDRNVVIGPKTPKLRLSACTPLWYVVYKNRPSAKAVIHTHSINALLATLLDPSEESKTLKITHLEMMKGVGNHGYDDVLEIPIIDNRPSEDLLEPQMTTVIRDYPKCNCVLVRRHGLYVWGDSWEQAKTQLESLEYLFQAAVSMKQIGINPGAFPKSGTFRVDEEMVDEPPRKKVKTEGFNGVGQTNNDKDLKSNKVPILPRDAKVLLLDIEGCTTSISFVKDELFPYVLKHLDEYVDSMSKDDYSAACEKLLSDLKSVNLEIPDDKTSDLKWMVQTLMAKDMKVPGLKSLQGAMWKIGYANGTIKGHVYSDFTPMLQWMKSKDVKVNIFSSGSVQAQKLLFGCSTEGDLCPYFESHFDITTSGNKKVASSYKNIAKSLNVSPSDIVFVSDAEAELIAAQEAGIGFPIMSIRPGNVPLTDAGKSFPTVYSLLQLCGE